MPKTAEAHSNSSQSASKARVSRLAGKLALKKNLCDPAQLENLYYTHRPDADDPAQRVRFGTSGHRGSSLHSSFNEAHIVAITQAICDYRNSQGIDGPLYLGKDTHALSGPAQRSALEVLAANGIQTIIQQDDGATPTPVISHAILAYNVGRRVAQADGIVLTPSHNPPEEGGIKYNPPHGGPAETDVTRWIESRANSLLSRGIVSIQRMSIHQALAASTTHQEDFVFPYVRDLRSVIDMEIIRDAGLKLGVDPMGGAGLDYWSFINDVYDLDISIVNDIVDPTFSFMTMDYDGKIRMDCSSPFAMARLIGLKDHYRLAFGNDTDADRHGIVTPQVGLLNPNHYLAAALQYLLTNRPNWPGHAAIGKTLVTSGIIDQVAQKLGRTVYEVPVGFKWFVPGLFDGTLAFAGEESAGATFLRRDGSIWTTDKDGLVMNLLAAEITARTGKDPGELFRELTDEVGIPYYTRVDTPATARQKIRLSQLSSEQVHETTLAGERITAKLTKAPGNGAAIGGLKVITPNGWFAARPSGTEDIYKIYAESFKSSAHLENILREAQVIVKNALEAMEGG